MKQNIIKILFLILLPLWIIPFIIYGLWHIATCNVEHKVEDLLKATEKELKR